MLKRKKGETQAKYELRVTGGHRLGAVFDEPDSRDYQFPHATAEEVEAFPAAVDLRGWDTTPRNQGGLGSCVAFAGLGVFEWLEMFRDSTWKISKWFLGSPLALYKWARDADGSTGDVGTGCRQVCSIMGNIGTAHESLWPYIISKWDTEPPQVVRNDAANAKATSYWRISTASLGDNPDTSVNDIKGAINRSLPVMFNFLVYWGYEDAPSHGGHIGMPTPGEVSAGGHANVVVGYDDASPNRDGSYGAFIVRNSWGPTWGNGHGYAYMPYAYAPTNMHDAWVIATESELVQPTPQPTPTPTTASGAKMVVRVRTFQPGNY